MDYCYSSHGIELHQTCGACPEQYDAYKDGVQCGYLRLRHGYFSVETTDHERRLVYEANPEGDGIFLYDERDGYLNTACRLLSEQSENNYKKKY